VETCIVRGDGRESACSTSEDSVCWKLKMRMGTTG
jgi:hypothetical protein